MSSIPPWISKNIQQTCGQRPIEENLVGRIVGGENSIFGEVPWQASLIEIRLFGLMKHRKCGAVIIGDKWLLTAAHCTSAWYFSNLIVVVGEHKVSKPDKNKKNANKNRWTDQEWVQERKVKRIINHPKFNSLLLEDDLAILELDEPVRFDMNVQPICLPDKTDNFTHSIGFVSGWGFMKYRKSVFQASF